MTVKNKEQKKEQNQTVNEDLPKTCFVIMPIADHPNYEPGHFKRVYEHLIAPACRAAGYEPVRADENTSSNMIMHDILLKILKSEMVICDLSTNNANVFYELGLRQAFNKKTVLITDGREKTPFDLLGFRYQMYAPSLRIDTVTTEIERISAALISTENMQPNEVNSIVKLLDIDSANLEIIQPNENQTFMLQMFNSLSAQISNLSQQSQNSGISVMHNGQWINEDEARVIGLPIPSKSKLTFLKIESENENELYNHEYFYNSRLLGKFIGYTENGNEIIFQSGRNSVRFLNITRVKAKIYAV